MSHAPARPGARVERLELRQLLAAAPVAFGDVNGDGRDDLLSVSGVGTRSTTHVVMFTLAKPDGTFGASLR